VKKYALLLLLITLLVSSPRIALAAPEKITREESLIYTEEVGSATIPTRMFNPYSPESDSVWYIGIFETLYIFDNVRFGLIPWIADGDPQWLDEYTLEVKLKPDVYWQDGTPLTAEDIVYSFELPKRYPETGAITLAMWPYVEKIEVIDEHTIRIYLNKERPNKPAVYVVLCEAWIVPKHIFEEAEKQVKSITEFAFENPVGSGPYKLLKWEPTRIVKARWDDWWGKKYFGLPEPKYLIYIPSTGNEETNRMLMDAVVDAFAAIAPNWGDMMKYGVSYWFRHKPWTNAVHETRINMFLFNNERMNKRFGKYTTAIKLAIAYAIDREIIAERGYFGLAVPLTDPTGVLPESPLAFLRSEDIVTKYTFGYDPDKAKKILNEANIKDRDGDGIRELPDGTPVTLVTIDVEGWTDWMAANELLKAFCKDVGIHVEVEHLDYTVWESRVITGDYDVMTYGVSLWNPGGYWSFLSVLDDRYPVWPLTNGTPAWYHSEEIQRIRDEMAKHDPFDPAARTILAELAAEAQEVVATDMPFVLTCVWGPEVGYQTKYWVGWPSAENPYAYGEQGEPGFLNILVHLKPATAIAPAPAVVAVAPELNQTLLALLNATQSVNVQVSTIGAKISDLTASIASLTSAITVLEVLVVIVLLLQLYLVITVRRGGRSTPR